MKQLAFMIVATLVGTAGVLTVSPFCGVAIYYLFAVLRPQYLWKWTLPPSIAWSQYVAIATLIGAAAYLIGFIPSYAGPANARKEHQRRPAAAHFAVLAFGGWVMVTFLGALDRETSLPWFIESVKLFVMFAASAVLIVSLRQLWVLYLIATLSLAYVAYEMNAIYVFQKYLILWSGYGGLDNNGAGLMLAMGVPLCAFAWEGTSRWWRWGFAAFVPPIVHAVLMTFSRGAMLALAIATPLFLLRARRKIPFAVGTMLMILALPFLAGREIRGEFHSIGGYDEDASAKNRFSSWKAGWDLATDNPIFGTGLRNSNLFSREYGADIKGRTIHSQYLQIAADSGLVGLGLYIVALFTVWRSLRRAARAARPGTTEDDRTVYAIACGTECSLAVFCIGAMFLSLDVFELPYLLMLISAQLTTVWTRDRLTKGGAAVPAAPTAPIVRFTGPQIGWSTSREVTPRS